MEVAILFTLILLNGVFAMSEIALVTARKARMQKFIDEGDRGAVVAIDLGKEPTRFLSTIQIGITSISIMNGIVGEAVLAKPLDMWLRSLGADPTWSEYGATILVVVTITYFSIVLGELVPKRLGQQNPELVARLVSRPIRLLAIATRPFVRLLAGSTDLVLTALGAKNHSAPGVTQEEIHAMLSEGSDSGVIEHHEHTMVRNVFRLDDRQLGSLMVPRADIVTLDANAPWEENQRRIEEGDHTRFPVVVGGIHEILGVVTARILLGKKLRGETPDLRTGLQPPVFVPESLTGMELLENFRSSGVQLAFVVDEYGEVLGMVTLKDVMEAITGEFKPRNVEDSWAIKRDDGSWLLDGLIPIPELKDRLSLKAVPEEARERYHTLSGLMMLLLGRLPQTADSVIWEGWKLEVVDIDGKRIDKVLAMKIEGELDTAELKTEA
jgi:putative hemolysin